MLRKITKITRHEMVEKLYKFYLDNISFIDSYLTRELKQTEKRIFVGNLFDLLEYSQFPLKNNNSDEFGGTFTLYRGVSASSNEKLECYINQFINGTMYFGVGPSVYGTGIYTCCDNNISVAIKYATNSFQSNCGAVIQFKLNSNTKIITYEKLLKYKMLVLDDLESMFSTKTFKKYIEILNDLGLFAAILGYECIYVEEMDYFVVLNRGKIIIEDIEYYDAEKIKKLSFI